MVIVSYSVVVKMALQLGSGYFPDLLCLPGSGDFQPLFKDSQLSDKLLASCNPLHPKPHAISSCAAIVGKTKEIKNLGLRSSLCSILNGKFAKSHRFGLRRLYLEVKLPQSLNKLMPKSLSVRLVLKTDNKVIGITNEAGITAATPSVDPFKPEIKGIVQIDVRQQR